MKNTLVYISTIVLLALFAGGSITIMFVVVPFWHSLSPNELMLWFHNFGPRVGITMLPMQFVPFFLSIYLYILARKRKEESRGLWLWINASNIIILIMLLAYFLPVNFQFVNQTLNPDDVPSELIRWEVIHIARTIFTVLSTVLAICAYSKLVRSFVCVNVKTSSNL